MANATKETPAVERHVVELDGIRGIAILSVMLMHFIAAQSKGAQNAIERVAEGVTGYGMWGVDLFFVLSGYLITGLLADTRDKAHYFRAFYMRRTLRIFPLYYGVLLVLCVLLPRGLLERFAPEALQIREVQVWLWTYLTNVHVARTGYFSPHYVAHFWTLAIEEHFYLVWPLVVRFTSREGAMRAAVGLSALALTLRICLAFTQANEMWAAVLTPCRLDALCIGGYFALLIRGPRGSEVLRGTGRILLGVTVAFVLLKALPRAGAGQQVGLALKEFLLALGFGVVVSQAAWAEGWRSMRQVFRWNWLRFLGKYSYGLYVFHGILSSHWALHRISDQVGARLGSHTLGLFAGGFLGCVLSIVVAVASYHLFEVHFLRLKQWFKA